MRGSRSQGVQVFCVDQATIKKELLDPRNQDIIIYKLGGLWVEPKTKLCHYLQNF